MFKPFKEQAMTQPISLLSLKTQLEQCITVCQQISKLPNKTADDLKINQQYLSKLNTASQELTQLQQKFSTTHNEENITTFAPRG